VLSIFEFQVLSLLHGVSAGKHTTTTCKRVVLKIRSMYIVYDETENHNNSKGHAIVRMANFKVLRNLISESLYEEISFYSFLGTQILSSYSKAYFASLLSLR
jgi:hypothetical protein